MNDERKLFLFMLSEPVLSNFQNKKNYLPIL